MKPSCENILLTIAVNRYISNKLFIFKKDFEDLWPWGILREMTNLGIHCYRRNFKTCKSSFYVRCEDIINRYHDNLRRDTMLFYKLQNYLEKEGIND